VYGKHEHGFYPTYLIMQHSFEQNMNKLLK